MKVAILTMFGDLDTTYSLVNVVAEQLRMLLDAGIPTKLLVCEGCKQNSRFGVYKDERIEWVEVTNSMNGKQIQWFDYDMPTGKVHLSFFEEEEVIAEDLANKLSDVDVCIMHDILYQGWHLIHNAAIRKAQKKLPNTRFISFSHSAPVNRPANPDWPFSARFTPMPHTTYISLTYAGISALAKQYDVAEGRCRVIYNSLDLLANMSEDVKAISQKVDLFSSDILIVYAGRLTQGKKFDKVAAFAGAMKKKTERNIKVIFCDFPSGDVDSKTYKTAVKLIGLKFGLDEKGIAFTSDLGYPNGFPRKGVLDLFTLSNLYVSPSYSEAFPLTVLEAAGRGNFLVLNQAVPALEEIGKQMNAYFMRWDARNYGFDTKESYHPSEQAYYEDHADIIFRMMRENPVIHSKTLVRQRYSPQWIWKNQFEPLLEI
ncbi:MAG: glycosyltransferase [Clostridia bacterium]|nr:glycosyltransferase [Clostridia bacterium]